MSVKLMASLPLTFSFDSGPLSTEEFVLEIPVERAVELVAGIPDNIVFVDDYLTTPVNRRIIDITEPLPFTVVQSDLIVSSREGTTVLLLMCELEADAVDMVEFGDIIEERGLGAYDEGLHFSFNDVQSLVPAINALAESLGRYWTVDLESVMIGDNVRSQSIQVSEFVKLGGFPSDEEPEMEAPVEQGPKDALASGPRLSHPGERPLPTPPRMRRPTPPRR